MLAQSAEDAAKYGQLQEIQVPAAGKLGKFIKKADPNVMALKISGDFNEKDWELLYSLPNVAYLDLQDVHNNLIFRGVYNMGIKRAWTFVRFIWVFEVLNYPEYQILRKSPRQERERR